MARAGVLGLPGLRGLSAGSAGVVPGPPGPSTALVMDSGYQLGSVLLTSSDLSALGIQLNAYDGALSDPFPSSGRYYIEFTNGSSEDGNGGWGLTTLTSLTATHPTQQASNFVAWRSNGTGRAANGTGFSIINASYTTWTNRLWGLAIDMTTGYCWVRYGGTAWFSGDPVAYTDPQFTIPAGSSAIRLYFTKFGNPSTGIVITSRGSQTWTAPTGYGGLGGV